MLSLSSIPPVLYHLACVFLDEYRLSFSFLCLCEPGRMSKKVLARLPARAPRLIFSASQGLITHFFPISSSSSGFTPPTSPPHSNLLL